MSLILRLLHRNDCDIARCPHYSTAFVVVIIIVIITETWLITPSGGIAGKYRLNVESVCSKAWYYTLYSQQEIVHRLLSVWRHRALCNDGSDEQMRRLTRPDPTCDLTWPDLLTQCQSASAGCVLAACRSATIYDAIRWREMERGKATGVLGTRLAYRRRLHLGVIARKVKS